MRRQAKKTKVTRTIAQDKFDFPQDQETVLIDGQDAWVFSRSITLPKSLRECLQTVDALGIKTKHNLIFNVKLINPDEHISELHASLPLYIYISPNLLLDDNNTMITQNLGRVDPNAFAVGAPPLYGEHQLDILYNDLDPTGYMTPAGSLSAISTPFSQSRRGSSDNLASMNVMTTAGVLPVALQSRLSSLDTTASVEVSSDHIVEEPSASEGRGLARAQSCQSNDQSFDQNFVSENQQDNGGMTARRTSDNDAEYLGAAQHVEFSPEELCKVPSYSTALRSHPQTPISEVPPTYQSATSQPSLRNLSTQPPPSGRIQSARGNIDNRYQSQR
ncbi:MAG: hypothetical protein L6R41_006500 [Letrouitia leprolyta]|nr:MAG: hypothetical protein L6R41_006500 [Letrouitia leprolyta]